MRYGKIFNLIDGMSQRMLTQTLKELERKGLVTRTYRRRSPPRVDYTLAKAPDADPAVVALWTWAQDHQTAI
jgi:DNA-binding HxlR family transcriptional regulator